MNWAEVRDEIETKGERLNGAKHQHHHNHTISDRLGAEARDIKRFILGSETEDSGGRSAGTQTSDKKSAQGSSGISENAEWLTFEMTSYTARCEGCSGVTSSGYDVRETVYGPNGMRILAADPSVLPIGTKVEVKVGEDWRFKAVVRDVGGAIKGNRLDFLVKTRERALEFGRQDVEVRKLNE